MISQMERLSLAWRRFGVSLGHDGTGGGGKEINTGESTIAVLKYTQVVENWSRGVCFLKHEALPGTPWNNGLFHSIRELGTILIAENMATLWAGHIKPQAHMFFKKATNSAWSAVFKLSHSYLFTASSLVLLPAGVKGLRLKKNVWKNITQKNYITQIRKKAALFNFKGRAS